MMKCEFCNKELKYKKSKQRFCDKKCYNAYRVNTLDFNMELICAYCEEPFMTSRKRKYCSPECRAKANGRGNQNSRKQHTSKASPPTESLTEAVANARKLGLTYGQYIALQMTKGGVQK